MHLEKALQTDKFRSEQHKLLLYLLHTRSVLHLEQKRRLKPWNITQNSTTCCAFCGDNTGNPWH